MGFSFAHEKAQETGQPVRYIGDTGQLATAYPSGWKERQTTAPAPAPVTTSAGGATAVAGGSEIMDLYKQALERLSTGGMSLEASLADIEAGKQQAIARGQQSMVSGGLAGTTVMGGIPMAAEKTAGRARLAARGEAESKYLGALTSYAGFAQRGQEAAAERQAAMQRLQMQIGSQERMTEQSLYAGIVRGGGSRQVSESQVGGPGYMASRQPSPGVERTMVSGLGPTTASNYSQQFPSVYGQGGAEEPVPQWM